MNKNEQLEKKKALQWLEGDDQMYSKLKAIFKKNIPSQVDQLRVSLETGDNSTAERVAHTIMGSSAMIGATSMSDEARNIEYSTIEGNINAARLHFTRFITEYEEIMEVLGMEDNT
jgi:HPt (histidine-containing phosphotransfer) domain-containing protein